MTEDPFEALAAEWDEQGAELERLIKVEEETGTAVYGAPSDAAGTRRVDLEDRISKTPTTTLFGIVTKLRVEVEVRNEYEFWTTENCIKTALAGAEYLLAQSQKGA